MSNVLKYYAETENSDFYSLSSGLTKAYAWIILPVMLIALQPNTARAEYAFFAESGTPYWRVERGVASTRERPDDAVAGKRSARTNRAARMSRAAAHRGASGRQTAIRPRLTQPSAVRASRVRVASLGPVVYGPPAPMPAAPSITGGLVAWRASASCLAGNLRGVIEQVASYGSVTVNSTCRSRARNRRVGGAGRSWHLSGNAADIRIAGNWRAAAAFLRSSVGGFKHYGGGLFHIDNGPTRRF